MYLTIKDSTLRFVLSKLTTDRHEALRGLFAIAELLIIIMLLSSKADTHFHVSQRIEG